MKPSFVDPQNANTSKLVMKTFYRINNTEGVTATDITKYLRVMFGNVWRTSALTDKAEQTLRHSAELGFLEREGNRYKSYQPREACGGMGKRRRRRSGCRVRKRSCCRRRRRRRRRSHRRRRRSCR